MLLEPWTARDLAMVGIVSQSMVYSGAASGARRLVRVFAGCVLHGTTASGLWHGSGFRWRRLANLLYTLR